MTKSFAFPLIVTVAACLAFGVHSNGAKAGLVDVAIPSAAEACQGVSLSRGLKYGDSDQNLVDVATTDKNDGTQRPVLLFVAGESFIDDGTSGDRTIRDQAMCLAAKNGLVGIAMTYRRAPENPWPAGARDVAAAVSWIHQNVDLFNGDRHEIVVVGYSVGAFHVASFLAHKEFQDTDSGVAGVVLVSGIYRPAIGAGDGERAYFGTDASKYDTQSGLTDVEVPIVLAWSTADPPRLVTQGEKLKEFLCGAGHCPRTAVLKSHDSPASVFDAVDTEGLADKTKQLISQLQARGLP
jgi:acetyl esterase/lipase